MTPAEIKSRYRLIDEIRSRGIEVNRQGFCRCPFHSGDDTPSMKVYGDQNSWHCYGCGEGGDIIDFVRKIDGLSFRDACKAISGEELTKEQQFQVNRMKLKREAEQIRERKRRKNESALADIIRDCWVRMRDCESGSEEWGRLYNKWQLSLYKYSALTGELVQELW